MAAWTGLGRGSRKTTGEGREKGRKARRRASGSSRSAVCALGRSYPPSSGVMSRLGPYNLRMNDTILRRIDEAVIVSALATVPLVVLDARGVMASWLIAANWAVWLVFLVDFAADFARKAGTGRKLFSFAIVVLSFPALPGILSLSRLARLSRLSRIARILRVATAVPKAQIALQRIVGRSGIRYLLGVTVIAVMSGGGLFFLAEPEAVGGFGRVSGGPSLPRQRSDTGTWLRQRSPGDSSA